MASPPPFRVFPPSPTCVDCRGSLRMIIGFERACSFCSSEVAVGPTGLAVDCIGVDRRRPLGLTHSTAEGACRGVEPPDSATPVEQPRLLQFPYSEAASQLNPSYFWTTYILLSCSCSHRHFLNSATVVYQLSVLVCAVSVLRVPQCGVG